MTAPQIQFMDPPDKCGKDCCFNNCQCSDCLSCIKNKLHQMETET